MSSRLTIQRLPDTLEMMCTVSSCENLAVVVISISAQSWPDDPLLIFLCELDRQEIATALLTSKKDVGER
jgi:hypothetical protein